MLTVKLIYNIDGEHTPAFKQLIKDFTAENVEFYELDTGSKKDIKQALHYFSLYASTETFIVIEKEGNVIDVIYKESVTKDNTWKKILQNKLRLIQNEY